jgi:hypothetical protein
MRRVACGVLCAALLAPIYNRCQNELGQGTDCAPLRFAKSAPASLNLEPLTFFLFLILQHLQILLMYLIYLPA